MSRSVTRRRRIRRRLLNGYGVSAPQHTAPGWPLVTRPQMAPGSELEALRGFGALYDWDPSWNPAKDKVGGLAVSEAGTGVTVESQRGSVCGVFGGSGYLTSASPFASLSDLSGGCTVYVVAERTDAAATAKSLVGIDATSGAAAQQILYANWNADNTVTAGMADTGAIRFDSQAGPSRSQLEVLAFRFEATSVGAYDGTTGANSTVASTDPTGLDRLHIGADLVYNSGASFVGRIWRVLICEGAFSSAALAYLRQRYEGREPESQLSIVATAAGTAADSSPAMTIPAGAESGDILLLFLAMDSATSTTAPSGWTVGIQGTGGAGGVAIYHKTSDGTESGTSVASSYTGRGQYYAAIIRGADSVAFSTVSPALAPSVSFSGTGFGFRLATSYNEPGAYTWESATELFYGVAPTGNFSGSLAQDAAGAEITSAADEDITNVANNTLVAASAVAYLAA